MSPARPAIASAIALPPGAVFEAVLEDVSARRRARAVELGRTTARRSRQPAVRLRHRLRSRRRSARSGTYSVRAQVSVGRRLVFVSDTMNPVLTRGAPDEVDDLDDQGRRHRRRGAPTAAGRSAPTACGCPRASPATCPAPTATAMRFRLNLWPDQVFHLRRDLEGQGRAPRFDRALVGRPGPPRPRPARRRGGARVPDPRPGPAAPARRADEQRRGRRPTTS